MLGSRNDRGAEIGNLCENEKRTLTAVAHVRGYAGAPAGEEHTASDAGATWTGCLVPAAAETGSCPGTEVVWFGSEMPRQPALSSLCGGRLILHRSQKRLSRCPRGRGKYPESPASLVLI